MKKLSIGWWNLQNLFNTTESELAKIFGYTREKGWDNEAYQSRIANLSAVIRELTPEGPPDLLGLCEVEDEEVLNDLIKAIGRKDYLPVAHKQLNMVALDTAFIYGSDCLELVGEPSSHIMHSRFPTRDVLEARFRYRDNGEEFIALAAHWPSRKAGRFLTEPFRIAAADQTTRIVGNYLKLDEETFCSLKEDELRERMVKQWDTKLIIMGDLNDEPFDRSVRDYLLAVNDRGAVQRDLMARRRAASLSWRSYEMEFPFLYNAMWPLLTMPNKGTYRHSNLLTGWGMLDQIIVSKGLLDNPGLYFQENVEIVTNDLIVTPSGYPRPFSLSRTNSRSTSDHLPLIAYLQSE